MRPRYALARRKAAELLQEVNVDVPPVPVEKLAESSGAVIRYEPFEGQMSGVLYNAGDVEGAVIGINALHPSVRQRFSITPSWPSGTWRPVPRTIRWRSKRISSLPRC